MKNLIEKIEDLICTFEGEDLIKINNTYCQSANYPDNEYFYFDQDFFETFFTGRPEELARAVFFGDIRNWNDEFIYFNGYGYLESTSTPEYCDSSYYIAEFIYNNPQDFKGLNDDLDLILNSIN